MVGAARRGAQRADRVLRGRNHRPHRPGLARRLSLASLPPLDADERSGAHYDPAALALREREGALGDGEQVFALADLGVRRRSDSH